MKLLELPPPKESHGTAALSKKSRGTLAPETSDAEKRTVHRVVRFQPKAVAAQYSANTGIGEALSIFEE
jgi:hypothetical protein